MVRGVAQMEMSKGRRIVVGITGASGSVYAVRFLTVARELGIEVFLTATGQGIRVASYETGLPWPKVEELASRTYRCEDLWAPISSGSFKHDGMIILPCSVKTLGSIANGICDNLLLRAADTCLKEGRPLTLVVRETPLSAIHIENMLRVSRAGGRILPASPAFYHMPKSLDELVDYVVGKAFDSLGIENDIFARWEGNDSLASPLGSI
jgi:4-hydroxy-3-polyprenylbenzoate decarboxylase